MTYITSFNKIITNNITTGPICVKESPDVTQDMVPSDCAIIWSSNEEINGIKFTDGYSGIVQITPRYAGMIMQVALPTIIDEASKWYKVAGITKAGPTNGFVVSNNCIIEWVQRITIPVHLIANLTIASDTNNVNVYSTIGENGTPVERVAMQRFNRTATDVYALSIQMYSFASTGSFYELFLKADKTCELTVKSMLLGARSM